MSVLIELWERQAEITPAEIQQFQGYVARVEAFRGQPAGQLPAGPAAADAP